MELTDSIKNNLKDSITGKEVERLTEKVLSGGCVTRAEALTLTDAPLSALAEGADRIRRHYCGNKFDMCAVISVRGGRCSEDCRFCPQAACSDSEIRTFAQIGPEEVLPDAELRDRQGIRHYGLVSSGRKVSKKNLEVICSTVREIRRRTGIAPCVSLGLLDLQDLKELKDAGVVRIHNNLETSEAYFPKLCTTHTWQEKKRVIELAHSIGLEVCSGGIMGTGESWEDRIDLALTERELGTESIPINMLHPCEGSPLGGRQRISEEELVRIVAIFRYILPDRLIRLAAGRDYLEDGGMACFSAGSNASITGDMLNVRGVTVEKDLEAIRRQDFEL